MREEILSRLREITPEERAILDGKTAIDRGLYSSDGAFVVDSRRLLEKGKLIDIRPHTRFVRFPRHRHNYVEMVYMCCGQTTHILGKNDRVVLREGDLLFLNQNAEQEILPASENDIAVNFLILPAFFDRSFSAVGSENLLRDFLLSTLSGSSSNPDYLVFRAGDLIPVQNLIENLIWTLLFRRGATNTINRTTMELLLMNLSVFAENMDRSDPTHAERNLVFSVLQYIDNHYRDGSLSEIAETLHEPTYALSRLLKKQTDSNFKELLQQRKLQQAAYLLEETPLPVENILVAIGYDNSSYFYRRFREKYGLTPKEYRRKEKQTKP